MRSGRSDCQRGDIEVDLRSIKKVLGMGWLRCKTPPMVHPEIAT